MNPVRKDLLKIWFFFLKLTNYSLSIFRSEPDNLHFHVGSTDGREHQLHLVPHAEHRAAENVIGPTP